MPISTPCSTCSSIRGADISVGRAFFRIGELRHDGQTRKGANRVDGEEQFFDISKRFEDVEVHAAFFESESLLVKNVQDLFREWMARLHADAQRADGAGDEDFASGGFAGFGDGFGDVFAFFFFFDGVGVFLAVVFFFLGDAFGFGVGDLAGLGEAFAML